MEIKHNPPVAESFEVAGELFNNKVDAEAYAAAIEEINAWVATLPAPEPIEGKRLRDTRGSARRHALAFALWKIRMASGASLRAVSA